MHIELHAILQKFRANPLLKRFCGYQCVPMDVKPDEHCELIKSPQPIWGPQIEQPADSPAMPPVFRARSAGLASKRVQWENPSSCCPATVLSVPYLYPEPLALLKNSISCESLENTMHIYIYTYIVCTERYICKYMCMYIYIYVHDYHMHLQQYMMYDHKHHTVYLCLSNLTSCRNTVVRYYVVQFQRILKTNTQSY